MKKIIAILALLLSITHLLPHGNLPTLTETDHTVLDFLYNRYKSKSTFYKTHEDHLIDGYVNLLAQRIQLFEYALQTGTHWKYLQGKNKEDCKYAAINSIFFTIAGLLTSYKFLYEPHSEFLSGKFTTIEIPYDLFKKVSSLRYTVAQKRYLRKFKVQKINIKDCEQWPRDDYKGEETIAKISSSNKEKLKYIALNYAITNHKKQLFDSLFGPACFLSFGILCGFYFFYAIFCHSKTIAKKLEQDKELSVVFTEEQEYRLSLKQNLL